jgi:hypothetical protein
MKDNDGSVNQNQQARIIPLEKLNSPSQTRQRPITSLPPSSPAKSTIFWIIGGIAILSIIGGSYLLFNQKRK